MAVEAWQQFDCYKLLGLHVAATPVEIRKAYYRASREGHPDRGGSHEGQVRVNLAHEVLSDPITRQAHDLFWYRFRAPAVAAREARGREEPAARTVAAPPASDKPLDCLWQRVRGALGYGGPVPRPVGPAPGVAQAAGGSE